MKRITIRCKNCAKIVIYNLRNGAKPNKLCNECDTKNTNRKTDLSEIVPRSKRAKFMKLY